MFEAVGWWGNDESCMNFAEEGVQKSMLLPYSPHQVYDYIRHFLSAVVQLTSLETSPSGVDATPIGACFVKCATIPIGIDPTQFVDALETDAVQDRLAELREQYGDRKVILGVDRMDYMKGIPHKLKAFSKFLDLHPEWVGECVLFYVIGVVFGSLG